MADMLATKEELASFMRRGDLADATAILLIEAATSTVQQAAGQRIVRVTGTTETIVVEGSSQFLRLPQRPVISVASVSLDGTALSAGTGSGNYRLAGDRLFRADRWLVATCGPSVATVVDTTGYLPTDQDIQFAKSCCLSIAAAGYQNPTGTTSERLDDYAVAYERAYAAMEAAPAMRAALRRKYGRSAGLVTI